MEDIIVAANCASFVVNTAKDILSIVPGPNPVVGLTVPTAPGTEALCALVRYGVEVERITICYSNGMKWISSLCDAIIACRSRITLGLSLGSLPVSRPRRRSGNVQHRRRRWRRADRKASREQRLHLGARPPYRPTTNLRRQKHIGQKGSTRGGQSTSPVPFPRLS